MKWEEVKLEDISTNIQTGPFGSQLHQYDYSETGTPVVMPKDLTDGIISEQSIARVSEDHVQRLNRHMIQKGDILYSRRGDVGRCALATEHEAGWLCGTGCLRITIDETIADSKFVFYQLQQEKIVGWVEKHAVGATMLNLNTTILSNIPLRLPPLEIQRRIADILSAYDDLIENNRKQIKLLEESAQRLYKEWFVDLRFPGHEHTRIVDGVPEGWEIDILSNVVKTASGGTPARNHPEYYTNGFNLWVKTQELTDGFILDTEEKITDEAIKNSSAKLVLKGSILMAMYGATIGKLGIATQDLTCNQACCVFDISDFKYGAMYLFCWLLANRNLMIKLGKGAAQSNLSQAMIKNLKILVPCSNVLYQFSCFVDSLYLQILNIQKQITILSESRDRLLPKLMSGDVEE